MKYYNKPLMDTKNKSTTTPPGIVPVACVSFLQRIGPPPTCCVNVRESVTVQNIIAALPYLPDAFQTGWVQTATSTLRALQNAESDIAFLRAKNADLCDDTVRLKHELHMVKERNRK